MVGENKLLHIKILYEKVKEMEKFISAWRFEIISQNMPKLLSCLFANVLGGKIISKNGYKCKKEYHSMLFPPNLGITRSENEEHM